MSALKEGEPANADDTWYRYITFLDHVDKQGNLKHAAFKNPRIFTATPDKKWKSELSGRLLSLTKDAVSEGEAYVDAIKNRTTEDHIKRKQVLMGCAKAIVQDVRDFKEISADVIYQPVTKENNGFEDIAHANVVFWDQVPEECKELTFFEALTRLLKFVPRSEM